MAKSDNRNIFLGKDPNLPEAFAPWYNHEYIDYYAVQTQDWIMSQPPIKIQANPDYNNWKVGPRHVDLYKESYEQFQILQESICQDAEQKNSHFSPKPVDEEIEPWKILVLYSIEPDMQLDCDVDLHWSQKLTGGSHGLRHMKVKSFGLTLGQADKSLEYYYKTAKKAYSEGNYYWGWRFLSRTTHYTADLGHPFHVKVAPTKDMFQIFKDFKRFMKLVATTHTTHEAYVLERFRNYYPGFKDAIQRGTLEGMESKGDFFKEIKNYRRIAAKYMDPLHHLLMDNFGDDLLRSFDLIEDPQYQHIDLSKRTNMARVDAIKVVMKDRDNPALNELDKITTNALYEVGKMLGMLFRDFQKFFSYSC